jgi:hypothetical protein
MTLFHFSHTLLSLELQLGAFYILLLPGIPTASVHDLDYRSQHSRITYTHRQSNTPCLRPSTTISWFRLLCAANVHRVPKRVVSVSRDNVRSTWPPSIFYHATYLHRRCKCDAEELNWWITAPLAMERKRGLQLQYHTYLHCPVCNLSAKCPGRSTAGGLRPCIR